MKRGRGKKMNFISSFDSFFNFLRSHPSSFDSHVTNEALLSERFSLLHAPRIPACLLPQPTLPEGERRALVDLEAEKYKSNFLYYLNKKNS